MEFEDRTNLKPYFIGTDQSYRCADGVVRRRTYLDSAATTLPLRAAVERTLDFLPHAGNPHSAIHFGSRISTEVLTRARATILRFLRADAAEYAVLFCGNGTTAAVERFARRLASSRADRPVVLLSTMEHHSNDLPHRAQASVRHIPLRWQDQDSGGVCLPSLKRMLEEERGRVRYVAVTAASNVTGVRTPVHEIAAVAHEYGVPLLVDGAALIAHAPFSVAPSGRLAPSAIDAFVFSGHKAYAPMSPGVLVIRRSLLEESSPTELGGGVVASVALNGFTLKHDPVEREHPGTPNVAGALMLCAALEFLEAIGMSQVEQHEKQLHDHLVQSLRAVPRLRMYGQQAAREGGSVGIVAFNVADLPHGFVAAVLNDYYNVSVRNECFCAQPYARSLLKRELIESTLANAFDDAEGDRFVLARRGMVRASLGAYSTREDIDRLVAGLTTLARSPERFMAAYEERTPGIFQLRNDAASQPTSSATIAV